jgi:hypothetical protein
LNLYQEHFQPFHIFHKIVMRSLRSIFWRLCDPCFFCLSASAAFAAAACALFSAADLFASSAFFSAALLAAASADAAACALALACCFL